MTKEEFNKLRWTEQNKYVRSCLDTIDFIPLIEKNETVHDILNNLEDYQDWTGTVFDNEVFSWSIDNETFIDPGYQFDDNELADYLNDRYEGAYYFREPEHWDPPIFVYKVNK